MGEPAAEIFFFRGVEGIPKKRAAYHKGKGDGSHFHQALILRARLSPPARRSGVCSFFKDREDTLKTGPSAAARDIGPNAPKAAAKALHKGDGRRIMGGGVPQVVTAAYPAARKGDKEIFQTAF
jgi:hypothetical protein